MARAGPAVPLGQSACRLSRSLLSGRGLMADCFTHFPMPARCRHTRKRCPRARSLQPTIRLRSIRGSAFRRLPVLHPARAWGSNLWMRDDVTGDLERLIQFVRRFAAEFHLTGRWGFQCATSRHIGSERISYWECIGRNGSDGAMADIHRCSSDDPPAGPLGHSPSYGEDRRHPDLHH